MAKLTKVQYRSAKGDKHTLAYTVYVSKKVAEQAGIRPDRELSVKAESGKIVIKERK